MQSDMNKNGLSNIVVGVLLIAVAIIGIVILFYFVSSFINRPELSPVIDCLKLQAHQEIKVEDTCLDKENVRIKVLRLNDNFDKLFFILQSDEGSSEWCCGEGCGDETKCELVKGSKNYFISSSELGDVKKVILNVEGCVVDEQVVRGKC